MTSFSLRAVLPFALLLELSSGCAHRNKPAAGASPPPSTSAPSATVHRARRPYGDDVVGGFEAWVAPGLPVAPAPADHEAAEPPGMGGPA